MVDQLDAKILVIIEGSPNTFDAGAWHSNCGTTHCRAGWAIELAGDAGRELERALGSSAAGALIYHASTGHIPDFYSTTDAAIADIRECARTIVVADERT